MNERTIAHYLEIYKKGLLEDILPFWMKHGIDREDGGIHFVWTGMGPSLIQTKEYGKPDALPG